MYRRKAAKPFAQSTVDVVNSFAVQAGLALVLAEGSTARQRIAVYQERERIARDLHDVIVQRLYAAGVQLELLGRRLAGRLDEADAHRIADTVDELDKTIAEVRATVRTLRSADPDGADGPPTWSTRFARRSPSRVNSLVCNPNSRSTAISPMCRPRWPTTRGPRCARHCPMWSGTPARVRCGCG